MTYMRVCSVSPCSRTVAKLPCSGQWQLESLTRAGDVQLDADHPGFDAIAADSHIQRGVRIDGVERLALTDSGK
nr:hypothetical protein [Nocardia tengchongensis]